MNIIIKHSLTTKLDKVQLVQFYPHINIIIQNNYTSEKYAKDMKDKYSIGMWRVKPTDK